MERKKLEALVWKSTHADFKGKRGAEKVILVNRGAKGTCSETLSSLTEVELLNQLPRKHLDKEIEQVYYARCNGIQIPLMKIPAIYAEARKAVSEGRDMGEAISQFVETIRVN